jgi:diguanylate cyclase (GGDEF)-like protein
VEIPIEQLPVATLVCTDDRVIEANGAACVLFAKSEAQLRDVRLADLFHVDDAASVELAVRNRVVNQVVNRLVTRLTGEASGTTLEITIASLGPEYSCLIARDVTELLASRRRAEELHAELRRQALHDPLTGLPNRALFRQHLDAALARNQRFGFRFGLLFVDLDRFKPINDAYGHDAGDYTLKTVAARLLDVVGDEGKVARLGGDEYVVISTGSAEVCSDLAGRIVDAIAEPIPYQATKFIVGCSVGIAIAQPDDSADVLLTRADAEMYVAKAARVA